MHVKSKLVNFTTCTKNKSHPSNFLSSTSSSLTKACSAKVWSRKCNEKQFRKKPTNFLVLIFCRDSTSRWLFKENATVRLSSSHKGKKKQWKSLKAPTVTKEVVKLIWNISPGAVGSVFNLISMFCSANIHNRVMKNSFELKNAVRGEVEDITHVSRWISLAMESSLCNYIRWRTVQGWKKIYFHLPYA